MQTVKQVEAGLMRYVERELLPSLVQLGDAMLVNLCKTRTAQLMGIVTPEGMINVDALRAMALAVIPEDGLTREVMGVSVRITRADVETMYNLIKEG